MSHNVSLPTHRYVYVIPSFVLRDPLRTALVPAMWVGVSVTPGRALGCHVLLENGALVVDVPLHALRGAMVEYVPLPLDELVSWDCFGWHAEAWQPEAISGLSCAILSEDHTRAAGKGTMWFAIDHMGDGYSMAPEQAKHLWIVERERDRALMLLPQDRVLIEDSSFTHIDGIPPIKRQSIVWYAE